MSAHVRYVESFGRDAIWFRYLDQPARLIRSVNERSGCLLLRLTAGRGQSLQVKRLKIDRIDKERRI